MQPRIDIDRAAIEAFCKKWKLTEFTLFGSVLRDDFRPDSDVDVMVDYARDSGMTSLDLARMEMELEALFRREVDLLTRRSVETSRNEFRREGILSRTYRLYAA